MLHTIIVMLIILLIFFIGYVIWAIIQDTKDQKAYEASFKHITRTYAGITFNITIKPYGRYGIESDLFQCFYKSINAKNKITGEFLIRVDSPIESQIQNHVLEEVASRQLQQKIKNEIKNLK